MMVNKLPGVQDHKHWTIISSASIPSLSSTFLPFSNSSTNNGGFSLSCYQSSHQASSAKIQRHKKKLTSLLLSREKRVNFYRTRILSWAILLMLLDPYFYFSCIILGNFWSEIEYVGYKFSWKSHVSSLAKHNATIMITVLAGISNDPLRSPAATCSLTAIQLNFIHALNGTIQQAFKLFKYSISWKCSISNSWW